ncbi:MAG TPA: FkbM family methyltransferase [Haliscomenobacter sp.]|uniref:FkbM family methyltransferase n=1 Tax=Haliscomenobacter sp. TaxID=2717303 RepID=UPI002B8A59FC|nr:FkbM family methyltransferase [Haliscomenobacter sp.]HOY18040.1 FkbM family methyltransferase [Haliscomenobacter sp.]HPH19774.1 FkbM family methyltransferase [Haliscomenobacter sp.]
MKALIQKFLKKRGFYITQYPDEDMARRMKIINTNHIDVVFDVGANIGQYVRKMREYGYSKKIISFEPLHSAFEQLKIAAANDNNWILNNYALGDEDVRSVINISDNSYSSSILNILPTHLDSAPQSKYIAKEEIEIKKMDTIFDSFCNKGDNVMLKIDTQGYEKNVIDGATKSLGSIRVIQLEMSILPLYENEMLYIDMINYLDKKGFQLFSLENGFSDENTGQLLQVDGIFVQKNRHA